MSTRVCRGVQEVTGYTRVYGGIQGFTAVYKGLQGYGRVYGGYTRV